jgi:hypothetical protein
MSQTETIMLVALGFAIAALIALFLSRFFWSVALRLGNKRLLRSTPTTIAELRADRDRLRAEYAMLSRKLQLKMDNIKSKLAEQMAEVTRNRNRIDHLIVEVRTRDALLAEREAEIARLRAHVDPLEAELADRTQSVQTSREQLRGRDAELARHHKAVEQMRAEIAERDRLIEALRSEAAGKDIDYMRATREVVTAQDRLKKRIEDLTSLSSQMEVQRLQLARQQSEFESLRPDLAAAVVDLDLAEEAESTDRRDIAMDAAPPLEAWSAAEMAGENADAATLRPVLDEPADVSPPVVEWREPEPTALIDEPPVAESPAPTDGALTSATEDSETDVPPPKPDTSLAARLAELRADPAQNIGEEPPDEVSVATDAADISARGKQRSVTNVISLAARIRALQKTAGE